MAVQFGTIGIDLKPFEEMSAAMQAAPENIGKAMHSSIRKGAFELVQHMKKAARNGLPEWEPLAKYTGPIIRRGWNLRGGGSNMGSTFRNFPSTLRGGRDKYRHGRDAKLGGFVFLGKLQNVFRYFMYPDKPEALVGVLAKYTSPDAQRKFEKFQTGGDLERFNPWTPSQGKYWAALGFHRRKNTTLYQPPRPLIGPVWEKHKGEIQNLMLFKFAEKLQQFQGFVEV